MKYRMTSTIGEEETQRIRLIKRNKGFVHEDLQNEDNYNYLQTDIVITHTKRNSPKRNIDLYQRALQQGYIFVLQDHFHYALENISHKEYITAQKRLLEYLEFTELRNDIRMMVYHQLATCYGVTNQLEKEHEITLQALSLDLSYPPFSCRMGEHFLRKGNLESAIFWYTVAYQQKSSSRYTWTLNQSAFYTWVPHQQLAFCYEQLGNHDTANKHKIQADKYQKRKQE